MQQSKPHNLILSEFLWHDSATFGVLCYPDILAKEYNWESQFSLCYNDQKGEVTERSTSEFVHYILYAITYYICYSILTRKIQMTI